MNVTYGRPSVYELPGELWLRLVIRMEAWCCNCATDCRIPSVASRDLRNHTADVLRTVSAGTAVTVTVNGSPVAEIRSVRSARSRFLTKADLIEILSRHQADAGLTSELQDLAGETTDALGEL